MLKNSNDYNNSNKNHELWVPKGEERQLQISAYFHQLMNTHTVYIRAACTYSVCTCTFTYTV